MNERNVKRWVLEGTDYVFPRAFDWSKARMHEVLHELEAAHGSCEPPR